MKRSIRGPKACARLIEQATEGLAEGIAAKDRVLGVYVVVLLGRDGERQVETRARMARHHTVAEEGYQRALIETFTGQIAAWSERWEKLVGEPEGEA